jgi:hypothetical protein
MSIASTILIGIISGIATTLLFEFILKTNKKLRNRYYRHHEILLGYHVHHSIYGLLFIIAGIAFYFYKNTSDSLFYISFGIGIIIQHTLSDGHFIFIEKQRK